MGNEELHHITCVIEESLEAGKRKNIDALKVRPDQTPGRRTVLKLMTFLSRDRTAFGVLTAGIPTELGSNVTFARRQP